MLGDVLSIFLLILFIFPCVIAVAFPFIIVFHYFKETGHFTPLSTQAEIMILFPILVYACTMGLSIFFWGMLTVDQIMIRTIMFLLLDFNLLFIRFLWGGPFYFFRKDQPEIKTRNSNLNY